MASFESLLASADVLVGSAEPGAAADVGAPELEAEAIAARHPHLVVASITAYGRTGPNSGRDVPGSVIDATSGMCWKAGLPEREPLMPPGNISGDVAGLTAAFAIVCALIQRLSHGAGQLIDLSANEADRPDHRLVALEFLEGHDRGGRADGDQGRPRPGCTRSWPRPTASCAWWCSVPASGTP